MSTTPRDAQVNVPPQELIANLANLYDRFAHALDPFSGEADEAERTKANKTNKRLPLRGVKFEDALRGLLQTPPAKQKHQRKRHIQKGKS